MQELPQQLKRVAFQPAFERWKGTTALRMSRECRPMLLQAAGTSTENARSAYVKDWNRGTTRCKVSSAESWDLHTQFRQAAHVGRCHTVQDRRLMLFSFALDYKITATTLKEVKRRNILYKVIFFLDCRISGHWSMLDRLVLHIVCEYKKNACYRPINSMMSNQWVGFRFPWCCRLFDI